MFQGLYRLLFPAGCAGCRASGSPICSVCRKYLSRALPTEQQWIKTVYSYQNPLVKKIVKNAKYHHQIEGLLYLAELARPELLAHIEKQNTAKRTIAVVPVPQHKKKTHMRGFNQAAKIAEAIFAASPSFTVDTSLLIKTRTTTPQAQIHTRSLRLQNTKNSMRASCPCDPETLYIIVDDVLTTGGTLIEARRALSAAGANYMIAITIAH